MADLTNEEFSKILQALPDDLKSTFAKYKQSVDSGTASTRQNTRNMNEAARGFQSSAGSLGGAIGSLTNYVRRINTEQMDPFIVGIEGISTALTIGEKGLEGLSGGFDALGSALGKGLGSLAKLGGGFADLAKSGVGVAKEAFIILAESLVQTQGAFKELTRSGVVLGSGITGIGELSTQAGVPLKALTKGLGLARQDLSSFGTGAGQATQKVAGVMAELTRDGGELYQQLGALGYSTEEQVALVAQQMAQDRAAGITRNKDNKEISREAVELGKNMKILADVTGKDAKQAMEQARIKSMEADLLAKAEAEGGAEGRKKLAGQLAAMPEEVKKGYLEFVSTGGQAVADAATNVAMQNNPKLREYYESMYSMLSDTGVKSTEASRLSLKGLEDVAAFAKENVNSSANIASAARLTGDALLGGATTINNALILMSTKLEKGTTDAVTAEADRLKKRDDPLLKFSESITAAGLQIQTDVQTMLRKPNEEVAKAMDKFTDTLKEGVKNLKTFIDDLIKEVKKEPSAPNREVGGPVKEVPKREVGGPVKEATEPVKERQVGGPVKERQVGGPVGGARETGGLVTPGNRYLVGEKGPEFIMPKSMSTVLPNQMVKAFEEFSQNKTDLDKVVQSNSSLTKEIETLYKSLATPATNSKPENQMHQSEMIGLLRQLVMTSSSANETNSEMVSIMQDIYSVQSRLAQS